MRGQLINKFTLRSCGGTGIVKRVLAGWLAPVMVFCSLARGVTLEDAAGAPAKKSDKLQFVVAPEARPSRGQRQTSVCRTLKIHQDEKRQESAETDWSPLLPDDDGKAEVTLSCSNCHGLKQLITQKKSQAGWQTSVRKMISTYQVPVAKDDLPTVISYLAKHFGESNPIEQLPININTGASGALERLPGMTAEKARAIVEWRETEGAFAIIEDLLRVKGIDVETLKKIRPFIKNKD